MKISSKGRYALRMMIDIAAHEGSDWIPLKDISERQGISVKYLEQIVNRLTKSGLLVSSRGALGGYRLTRRPEDYTAGQILRVIEGSLAPVACLDTEINLCDRRAECPSLSFWQGMHNLVNDYVDSVTLKELVSSVPADGSDFCI